jgi:hypothetical protein
MKATIVTKITYNEYIEKLVENNPELEEKNPSRDGGKTLLRG